MQQKEVILEGTIKAFNEKGLKFTMDDVAKILGMSKKTIYTVFRDKESMFLAMVDYMFDSIKESEQQIVEDDALSTVEKIRRILGVIPESYRDVDFRQLYLLKDKYPVITSRWKKTETGWETTIRSRSRMAEGVVRKVSIPIVKMMLEATVEQFPERYLIQAAFLSGSSMSVSILVNGIVVPEAAG
ncbi:TetR/AcrR family transcriptional regulator [Clostridium fessum]|uniref:TetR/AcrR family transcriptional regulator n=1 Tax=Clostridium fessum TaxID=2126740 RepID=UPI00399B2EA5